MKIYEDTQYCSSNNFEENVIFSLLGTKKSNYLKGFIKNYNEKTKTSKSTAHISRAYLCNNRKSSSGFNLITKELTYPIIASKSKESKIWDIDGNEYIDLSMGYGANLFGHNPSFIQEALTTQISKGYQLGPESEYAAKCAHLVSKLSSQDRVLFNNSGTESIVTAIRIARAFRRKDKIVLFYNSYHGHSDNTLVLPDLEKLNKCKPMYPGIPTSAIEDIILLPFNNKESIKEIIRNKNEIAAVLVEPVQNSQPDVHPSKFIEELRAATQENNISLIFDEVLIGFRIAAGGAQEWFNISADLVVYGKIIGGGLPLAAIAGKKDHMDMVDGGMWNYGDMSKPLDYTTFTAGTYCKHPLAMATCYATLNHIKETGPKLYTTLNNTSLNFYTQLNEIFEKFCVPIKVCYFGSFFRFAQEGNLSFSSQPLELDIFFYHLISKGIYVWECKTCFISTSHSQNNLNKITQAVHESIQGMKDAGFWEDKNK